MESSRTKSCMTRYRVTVDDLYPPLFFSLGKSKFRLTKQTKQIKLTDHILISKPIQPLPLKYFLILSFYLSVSSPRPPPRRVLIYSLISVRQNLAKSGKAANET